MTYDSLFQSAPPVRAATVWNWRDSHNHRFQSAPPVRAATLYFFRAPMSAGVSIRTAREGGDIKALIMSTYHNSFNPHRP